MNRHGRLLYGSIESNRLFRNGVMKKMIFKPDYRHILEVLKNRRPERLPLYEHYISPKFMEKCPASRVFSFALNHSFCY
jgi:hypothetical protein